MFPAGEDVREDVISRGPPAHMSPSLPHYQFSSVSSVCPQSSHHSSVLTTVSGFKKPQPEISKPLNVTDQTSDQEFQLVGLRSDKENPTSVVRVIFFPWR